MSTELSTWVNPEELASLARMRLPEGHWAYLHGAAGEGHTAAANTAAWAALPLLPRILRIPARGVSLRTTLAGQTLPHPIWLAPVAHQALAHPDAERATAIAAAAQGAGMVLSQQANTPMEEVAGLYRQTSDEDARGMLWLQMSWQGDLQRSLALATRAQEAGFEAIVLGLDAPIQGVRDEERRAHFRLPPGVHAVNLPPPQTQHLSGEHPHLEQALSLCDVRDLVRGLHELGMPVWAKGVLHPGDAHLLVDCGVVGLIVSNHGGRTLDTVVPTAWALPRVRQAVGPALPVLVDGGIRRGTDVLKALALGADGVLIGRPQVHALAVDGAQGVARLLRVLQDELAAAMVLTGCVSIAALGQDPHCGVSSQFCRTLCHQPSQAEAT